MKFTEINLFGLYGALIVVMLICNIAVMGDRSVLNRFAYQATVFLDADNGTISGTIRWPLHNLLFNGPGTA